MHAELKNSKWDLTVNNHQSCKAGTIHIRESKSEEKNDHILNAYVHYFKVVAILVSESASLMCAEA